MAAYRDQETGGTAVCLRRAIDLLGLAIIRLPDEALPELQAGLSQVQQEIKTIVSVFL
jgi:hypothetical protein